MEELNKDSLLEIPKLILIEDLGMMYPTKNSNHKSRFGIYKCGFCGNNFRTNTHSVNAGTTKSCGCYQKKLRDGRFRKQHGLSNTRLYNIWRKLKDRVSNIKNKDYQNYGGRGISICEEWLDVQNFYDWAMSNGYSDGLSLDRIDNDGNYEPSNCRWTTRTIQSRNQRMQKNNKSGYRGVSYNKSQGKYKAQIRVNKIHIHLGSFLTAVEGAIAYNNYIIENNLEGFVLNEIPEEIT